MTVLERIPRIPDFAVWATACEAADGTFMSAYAGNTSLRSVRPLVSVYPRRVNDQ
jgi:hypothetical protein